MTAIFKREFKAYFTTLIGYIFLSAMVFFLGDTLHQLYKYGMPNIELANMRMSIFAIFLVPVITMRLFSEERGQKIDQVLVTAPIKISHIIWGKFLAALSIYALSFTPTIIFQIIISSKVSVSILPYLYSLLGILLFGATLIAIGMFISTITESVAISAILTLIVNVVLLLFPLAFEKKDNLSQDAGIIQQVFEKIKEALEMLSERTNPATVVQNFADSVFSVSDVVYFVSIIAIFVFLSVRSLEKRRWS